MKYIGGEIEYENNKDVSKIILDIENEYNLYSTGRTALKYILQTIDIDKPILLPSYMCKSIAQPFDELNFSYQFYKINSDFSIDIKFLNGLLQNEQYAILLFINYFGFYNDIQINEIKEKHPKLILIEDCTHSTFIPNLLGKREYKGDIAFGSLRKTLPLSDGAFIVKSNNFNFKSAEQTDKGFSILKQYGKKLRKLNTNGLNIPEIEDIYLELLSIAEDQINTSVPDTKISDEAFNILGNINFNTIFEKRVNNYNCLYKLFNQNDIIRSVGQCIKELSDNEMPYMLPFYITNNKRDRIRQLLRKKGVFTSIIWGEMPLIDKNTYKDTYELGKNILCFPIDQRYNSEDMHIMYLTVKEIINKKI